jgi:hypothetical protein
MKTEASKQHEHDDVPHSTVLVIYHINTASTVSTLGLALHFDIHINKLPHTLRDLINQ